MSMFFGGKLLSNIMNIAIIGTLAGVVGTGLGGVIAIFLGEIPKKLLGIVLYFSAFIMLVVVGFELIPEAIKMSNITVAFFGIILGTFLLIIIDFYIKRIEVIKNKLTKNSFLKTGILIAIGISLHNFPEGLAVGSGIVASIALGLNIALVIAIHDIPEGIAVALPLKIAGISNLKVLSLVILSGLPTGLGALIGAIIGNISTTVIALCLSGAAGAMLYIVANELIPQARKLIN